jgi:hypothetical protein
MERERETRPGERVKSENRKLVPRFFLILNIERYQVRRIYCTNDLGKLLPYQLDNSIEGEIIQDFFLFTKKK